MRVYCLHSASSDYPVAIHLTRRGAEAAKARRIAERERFIGRMVSTEGLRPEPIRYHIRDMELTL